MTLFCRANLFGILVSLCATSATAQIGGSRLNRVATPEDAAEVAQRFGECIAAVDHDWSRAFLVTLPGSAAEHDTLAKRKTYDNRCLGDRSLLMDSRMITINSQRLRRIIGTHLGMQQIQRAAAAPTAGGAMGAFNARVDAQKNDIGDRGSLFAQMMGACLVDEHWQTSRDYVVTEIGSEAEARAFHALSPALSACVPSGAKLGLNHVMLRASISEAAFHAFTYRAEGGAN